MIKKDRYTYDIDDNNAIRVWDDENPNEKNAPFLYQPDRVDGTPWGSRAEAEEWTLKIVDAMIEHEANIATTKTTAVEIE